jgi:hypothetical protein
MFSLQKKSAEKNVVGAIVKRPISPNVLLPSKLLLLCLQVVALADIYRHFFWHCTY